MDIKQKIISISQQAGACSIGFADIVEVSKSWCDSFDAMVSEGRHGTMAFMERNRDIRQNPALLLEGAKTLISLAFSYDKGIRNPRIASYALVPDYHYFLRQLLSPVITFLQEEVHAQCRICVDSAPVAERFWALRTGVGVKGRNQQLMVPGVGARVFLAEIITTAHIPPDPVVSYEGYADVCIGCDRCVRACPNGALEDPERFDASRCVSYLTIEHRGELPKELNLAGKIYGCDICLDACPYNHMGVESLLSNARLKERTFHEETPTLTHRTSIVETSGTQVNVLDNTALDGKHTQGHFEKQSQVHSEKQSQVHSENLTEEHTAKHTDEPAALQVEDQYVESRNHPSENHIESPNLTLNTTHNTQPDPDHFQEIVYAKSEPSISEVTNLPVDGIIDSKKHFKGLHVSANSPFEIDTDILSLTTQDIENMTSGQYRRLTKKSAMSRCPLSQLRRNL